MAKSQFGKTWWGAQWIQALEKIDLHQNRLPRGRRYARNDSVQHIEIKEGVILSRVRGRRPSPYKQEIRLKRFPPGSEKFIREMIRNHPALEAELDLGQLPEEMKVNLEKIDLALFPESWDEIEARCSCPDWANPCKHLAAVYYLIAHEVDRDPFTLFAMRGIDPHTIRRNLSGLKTKKESRISGVSNETRLRRSGGKLFLNTAEAKKHYFPVKREEINDSPESDTKAPDRESIISFDFERVDQEAIFALLQQRPLFYEEGDFHAISKKIYKNALRNLEGLNLRSEPEGIRNMDIRLVFPQNVWDHPQVFLTGIENPRTIFPGIRSMPTSIAHPDTRNGSFRRRKSEGFLVPFNEFLQAAMDLPLIEPDDPSPQSDATSKVAGRTGTIEPGLRFFSLLSGLAFGLLRSRSFLPVVEEENDGEFRIRYWPHVHSKPIARVIADMERLCPPGFAFRDGDGRLFNPLGIDFLVSLLLDGYFRRLAILHRHLPDDKILHAFFEPGSLFVPESFSEKNTGKSIKDWLESLSTLGTRYSPVIRIEKVDVKSFSLHIDVEDRMDPGATPESLETLFGEKTESSGNSLFSGVPVADIRPQISRQILIASRKIPVFRDILDRRGALSPDISLKEMAAYLGEYADYFRTIGIRFILPRELQELLKPVPVLCGRDTGINQHLSLDSIFSFDHAVALGNETISLKEFQKLVHDARGLVEFRGQYLLLEPADARKILKRLEEPGVKKRGMELLRAALSGELNGMDLRPGRRLQQFLERLVAVEEVKAPIDLQAKLRAYQKRGYSWLYSNYTKGLGSCLADDMGLGKTLQTIAFLLKLKEEGCLKNRALVVVPTTLLANWEKEIRKFAPALEPHIYHGPGRTLNKKGVEVILTTYATLANDMKFFQKRRWSVQILDEAQAIKNRLAARTKSVKKLNAGGYVALSGTPVENHTGELWSVFDFINPGLLGDAKTFRHDYSVPIERYRSESTIRKLKTITAPFLMRRLKTDQNVIRDLPEKIIIDEYCRLTRRQAGLYREALNDIMRRIEEDDGSNRQGLVFKLMTSLKQICNHPAQFAGGGRPAISESGKLKKTITILEKNLSSNEKTLIFTQYRKMAGLLADVFKEELGEYSIVFTGLTSRKNRTKYVERFQSDPARRIMIVTLQSGGVGLNLTAANHVIHYDKWWNPAVENQATDRTFRIGQKRNVYVYRLVTLGTFEEKIEEMLQSKSELADLTVSAGEKWIHQLSNAELKDVFALSEMESAGEDD